MRFSHKLSSLALTLALAGLAAACQPIELATTPPPTLAVTAAPTTALPATPTTANSPSPQPSAALTETPPPSATVPAAATLPETVPPTPAGEVTGGLAQGGTVPPELVQRAVDDLAQRTGAAVADIQLIEGQSVLWNDGSLGCPEPGMTYTQAEVAGYRMLLSVGGATYDYRASERFVQLCEAPVRPLPGG